MKSLFYPTVMHSLVIGPEQVGLSLMGCKVLKYIGKSELLLKTSVTNNNSKLYI